MVKVSLETLTREHIALRDAKASLELFLHLDNTFSKDTANEKEHPENKRRARIRAYGQLAELLETIRVCYVSRQNELALEVKDTFSHKIIFSHFSPQISQIFTENLHSFDLIVVR